MKLRRAKNSHKVANVLLIAALTLELISVPRVMVNASSNNEQIVSSLMETTEAVEVVSDMVEPELTGEQVFETVTLLSTPIDENVLQEEVDIIKETENIVKEELERERIQTYLKSVRYDVNDITVTTGLNKEDYKYLTKDTWWEGNEETLYMLENTYGINAMFAMAVSTLESGHGTSDRARYRNNYYGMELSRKWNNLYDCTDYWGGMLHRIYVSRGHSDVSSISRIYCPPNSSYWASYMLYTIFELRYLTLYIFY